MKLVNKQRYEVMSICGPKRVNYFYGEVLSVDDFQVEQDFYINKLQQHNRAIFNPGIIKGLKLSCSGQFSSLSPGFAMDVHGRLIEVPTSYNFDLPDANGIWEIILELTEQKCDPIPDISPGLNDNELKESRIQEITIILARDISEINECDSESAIILGQIEAVNGKYKVKNI